MERPGDLADLISVLEEADSPFERLHQLALAWRSIRRMDAEERLELARRAGFDGAEGIVERLAGRHGGLAPALLLQAIQRARNADSGQLNTIFRQLRDPESRGAVISKGVRMAGETLAEALEENSGTSVEPGGEVAGEAESSVGDGREEPEERSVDDVRPRAVQEPEPGPEVEPEPGTDGPEALPPAESETGPHDESPAGPGKQPLVAGEGPADGAPRKGDREVAVKEDDEVPARSAPGPPAGIEGLMRRLREEPKVIRRLHLLRRERVSGSLDADDVQGILAGFPWGWARRRALCILIEGGALDRYPSPVELVRSLSPGGLVWCLTALARRVPSASWGLDDLTSAVESPVLRRRLRSVARP